MTRTELIERLRAIQGPISAKRPMRRQIDQLIEDIEADGVLDVQAPSDIASSMGLPASIERKE